MWCNSIPKAPCTSVGGNTNSTKAPRWQSLRSYHPTCVNVMLADGSIRIINNSVNPTVYKDLGTIAGSEVAGDY